jgi:hypothetical protein
MQKQRNVPKYFLPRILLFYLPNILHHFTGRLVTEIFLFLFFVILFCDFIFIFLYNHGISKTKENSNFFLQVTTAIVKIVEKPWERVSVDGQPHEHG